MTTRRICCDFVTPDVDRPCWNPLGYTRLFSLGIICGAWVNWDKVKKQLQLQQKTFALWNSCYQRFNMNLVLLRIKLGLIFLMTLTDSEMDSFIIKDQNIHFDSRRQNRVDNPCDEAMMKSSCLPSWRPEKIQECHSHISLWWFRRPAVTMSSPQLLSPRRPPGVKRQQF